MKKRYETVTDALQMLTKLDKCKIDDTMKQITHSGELSLKASGALDFLRKNGYTISPPAGVTSWNIYIRK